MRWRRNTYSLHRWLGLVVSFQLLAWSIGGFMFSILDIDNVHGDWERAELTLPAVRADRALLSPAEAIAAAGANAAMTTPVTAIRLRQRFERTVYELFDTEHRVFLAVDAVTGEVIRRISPEDAARAAVGDFAPEASVASIKLLEDEPPLEYRGGAMPVYRVILDHPKEPHLYVSPVTGEVLTRRNRPWRIFDFFWMLHIMDYQERENFNHWLLTTMSLLAVLTSATGLTLWIWRIPRRRA